MTSVKPNFNPLYEQISHQLADRIAAGEWMSHDALPSEWALAASLRVSQGTVRKALASLVSQGLLYRQQGKGTFVAAVVGEWGEGGVVQPGQAAACAEFPRADLLACVRDHASEEVAERLGVRRAASVYRIRQVWRLGGAVIALDDAYVSADRFEAIDARRLRQYDNSLYALLARREGVRVVLGARQVRAVLADREAGALLTVPQGTPLLLTQRVALARSGEVVEWRLRLARCERWSYCD